MLPGNENVDVNIQIILKACDTANSCSSKLKTVSVKPKNSLKLSDIYKFSNQTLKYLKYGMLTEALALSRSVLQTLHTYKNHQDIVLKSLFLFQDHVDTASDFLIAE